ncbi:MAG: pyridoxal phosphate-dependent aminotransferase, partial [Euryarchaeota archaeon]|nr:pyridoxal phosphate-dependent aminotransferase [Euryarchaeota archaeon]
MPEAKMAMTKKTKLDNYVTASQGRVGSTKDLKSADLDKLMAEAMPHLKFNETYQWDANINGMIIRLVTNSRHQYEFWVENWYPGPNDGTVHPHGFLYSISGVPNREPHAFYCREKNTALFLNTEYYGQCKSWALGLAAVVLEQQFNTHSIHGAAAEVNGKGVVIIAPTGTGKTTQVNRIIQ